MVVRTEKASSSVANGPPSADHQALDQLDRLVKELKALKATYELYFMGIERAEPIHRRAAIKRQLQQLFIYRTSNTLLKFKIQQFKAQYASVEGYWNRIQQQREAGTYHRDLRRLKQKDRNREVEEALVKPTLQRRPSIQSSAELTDDKLQKLHSTYLVARKRCGESTNLPYEVLAERLRKQVPELMQRTGATRVDFKVVIRDGKAVLKALPQIP